MKKVLLIFGTRPEAIKIAPLIKTFQEHLHFFEVRVCVTAQHREMLDQVLEIFDIRPDYDLDIMKPMQDLYDITSNILNGLKDVLDEFNPDLVLVHGDTTTSFSASLAAFYKKIKIGHIEAGLRTGNLYSPWPEEANRKMNGVLADYHFAPTENAKQNLIKENKDPNSIIVTGNTVIDALFMILKKIKNNKDLANKIILDIESKFSNSKFILVTGHRRENFGQGFINICEALRIIALKNPEINVVYPVHLNPNVQSPVKKILSGIDNVYLIEPLSYEKFIYLMSKSYFIITDSGGVQEEAPSLGKPVLVTRNTTERPEAVETGTVMIVGTKKEKIIAKAQELIEDRILYEKISNTINPYGDGKACQRIVKFIMDLR